MHSRVSSLTACLLLFSAREIVDTETPATIESRAANVCNLLLHNQGIY